MGWFSRRKVNASFDFQTVLNMAAQKTTVKTFKDIDSLLAMRVLNKVASYIMSDGFKINFNNDSLNDKFYLFAEKHNLRSKLLEAVKNSMIMREGCMVYLVGGLIDEELINLEAINLIDMEHIDIKTKDAKQIYMPNYHENEYIAKVSGGDKIIHPSRRALINLFPSGESSFIENILPMAKVIETMIDRGGALLEMESALMYKSSEFNKKALSGAESIAYRATMKKVKDNLKGGTIAIIPSKDDMINFKTTSSMDKIFPIAKDVFTASVGVPKSILFGEVATGLNTGAGKQRDNENFMRDVRGWQEGHIKPVIDLLVNIFKRQNKAVGAVPYEIEYGEIMPLEAKEQADIAVAHNNSLTGLVENGLIIAEEGRANLKGIEISDLSNAI